MDREQLIESLIANGKRLKRDDIFEFECSQCGSCCYNRVDILLTPYDITRISKALGQSPYEMVQKYCDYYVGNNSNFPIFTVKFKESHRDGETFCPFLKRKDGKGMCQIHSVKPFSCGAFPLGRMIDESDKTKVHYFNQFDLDDAPACSSLKRKYTVSEWLGKHNLEESEEAFILSTDLIIGIKDYINLKKLREDKRITDKTRGMIYTALAESFYLNVDQEKNIIEAIKESIERTKEVARLFVAVSILSDINISGKKTKMSFKEAQELVSEKI